MLARLRTAAIALTTTSVLLAGLVLTAAPASASSGTLVVGDSLTYRGSDKLRALREGWRIDGVPGSTPATLASRLQTYIERNGMPRQVVIALGTNEGRGYTRAVYENAVAMLAPSTRVVFVTMYRDPRKFGAVRAERARMGSVWMKQVAAGRPHTAVAPWRAAVLRNPRLLVDGCHATRRAGERTWAATISATMGALTRADQGR